VNSSKFGFSRLASSLVLGCVLSATCSASSPLLGTYAGSGEFSDPVVAPTVDFPFNIAGVALGENLQLQSQNATAQFDFKSNTDDPDFSNVVAALTNGIDNPLSISMQLHGTAFGAFNNTDESAAFGTHPDFAAYHVDEIRLTVDPFLIIVTPPNPGFPNGLTTVFNQAGNGPATYHWNIFGTAVPEPSAISLMAVSLVGFVGTRRQKLGRR
jgi:hypothetical protein